jgi:D-alanyl-D-alanine carboxypeptidase
MKFRPLLLLLFLPLGATALLAAKDVRSAYIGAIAVDAADGRVLFEDNADVTNPPASMTKLMTFAVLHDKLTDGSLKPDTLITVNREEAKFAMKSDSTAVWLKEKETFPVEELIYAMMIQSANDAALVLARAAAGSPEAFVELMNAKARSLGMTRTSFRTPHGLSKGRVDPSTTDLTTPRDYAVLSRYLVQSTDALKYTAIKTRQFGAGQRTQLVDMRNHNNLLGKFAGLDGLKTGYTGAAGFCLAATAERNGRRIIVVVMGSPASKVRDLKVMELLERGFASQPAAPAPLPTVRTDGVGGALRPDSNSSALQSGHKAPPTQTPPTGTLPTVKTDKLPAPAPAGESSTAKEPTLTFRVIPPTKKP